MREEMPLERPLLPVPGPRRVLADFGGPYAASALVAFLFSCTGPVAIILAIGAQGGLSESDIASWIFSAFCFNTLISIAFTLVYRPPLIFLRSIPAAVLVGPALSPLPRLGRLIPPLIAAVIVGALAIGFFGKFRPPAGALFALAAPNLYVPQFSWNAMVELVVPLAITVLAVQNGQGVAVLAANG